MTTPEKIKPQALRPGQSFDCDQIIPFSIKKNQKVQWYCIGMMSGDSRDSYMIELTSGAATSVREDGTPNVTVKAFKGMSVSMLKHCVYGYNQDTKESDGTLVPPDIIAAWPAVLIDYLVTAAGEINAIGEAGKDEGKND